MNVLEKGRRALRKLPSGIWVLGFASLFMDVSSELIHSLLPIFLTTTLGASMVTLGFIEGIAEATTAITKVFSGALSDYLRKRKIILVMGYGLAMLTKPVIPAAHSISWVFGAHIVDRMGKGIREAPRDALIADITPPPLRGAAYGLRQALDSVGAVFGPLLAFFLMLWFAGNIRAAMWIAIVPAFICVAILVIYLREPEAGSQHAELRARLKLTDAKQLPQPYWFIVLLGAVFTLARFSEAFLVLRAQDIGMPISDIPLVMVAMSFFYAAFAFPAGAAADHVDRRYLLLMGLILLAVADIVLARANSAVLVFVGAALWGLHLACTQGLLSKLVADAAPDHLRGSAFGIFNLVSGLALLLASAIAGSLWAAEGAPATFIAGAGFATLAAIGLLAYRNQ
jgi:MFS family permease